MFWDLFNMMKFSMEKFHPPFLEKKEIEFYPFFNLSRLGWEKKSVFPKRLIKVTWFFVNWLFSTLKESMKRDSVALNKMACQACNKNYVSFFVNKKLK
jgi:hypothetical protein